MKQTTVRQRLDDIAQRADRMSRPDPTGMRIPPDTYLTDADRKAGDWHPIPHIVSDLNGLVAALRAVLDRHWPDRHAHHWPTTCAVCSDPTGDALTYPCPTVRAITEALS